MGRDDGGAGPGGVGSGFRGRGDGKRINARKGEA